MNAPCALPWLPATHAVAAAETDDAALAVLASAPSQCTGDCGILGRGAARQHARSGRCSAFRAAQYAAVVLVCACEGGSLPSANAALAALVSAGTFEEAPTRADGRIWHWLARALTRAMRGCVARGDEHLAALVAPRMHELAEQTTWPRAQFWIDGGFGAVADALWQSDSPRCAAVATEGVVEPSLVAQYLLHAERHANDSAVNPRAFAAFWAPVMMKLDNTGGLGHPLCGELGRALARGEWRATSAWLAAWDATGFDRNDPGAVTPLSNVWPLCVAALTASPLGAECRLLRRLVRSDAMRLFDDEEPLAARVDMLWDSAVHARRVGAQATTGDLAPWMRLCAELHPDTTAGWVERRVRRALCAYGRRE